MGMYFQDIFWKNVANILFLCKFWFYHPHAFLYLKAFKQKHYSRLRSTFCKCLLNQKSGNKRSGTNRTELEGLWCIQSLTCTWDWWELRWSSFLSSSSHSCSKLVSLQHHFQIVQIFYSYNCFLFLHTCFLDLHNECTSL